MDSLPAEAQGKPKKTGVVRLSLSQWIFTTQELNWGLLYCRRRLYQLSYEGSPDTHRVVPQYYMLLGANLALYTMRVLCFFFFFGFTQVTCRILVPDQDQTHAPATGVQSPNHCTAQAFPWWFLPDAAHLVQEQPRYSQLTNKSPPGLRFFPGD